MALFKQVTIAGLGLIGGSLGMAMTRHRLASRVVGLSRSLSTIRRAQQKRAIDDGTTDPRRAVAEAELVIIATPVGRVIEYGKRLASWMSPGSVLSDVGSTKAEIVHGLRSLPNGVAFMGAHPLAGSEQRGIDAARTDLFDGSICILTPNRRTDQAALKRVRGLWSALAGRVLTMEPEAHDRLLAAVSHLPHLLAFCLVDATEPRARAIAPRSFLDATRVAMSDPDLWDDIFLTNRAALLRAMDRFEQRWRAARQLLRRGDRASLHRFLRHAQGLRQRLS